MFVSAAEVVYTKAVASQIVYFVHAPFQVFILTHVLNCSKHIVHCFDLTPAFTVVACSLMLCVWTPAICFTAL